MIKVSQTKAKGKFNYINVINIDNDDGFNQADRNMLHKQIQDLCYEFERNHTTKSKSIRTVVF